MKKVLVIDTDQAFRRQLAPWLQQRGWSLVHPPDGQDGLQLALAERPEIVWCDLQPAHFDGLKFCRALRSHQETKPGHPFIIAAGTGLAAEKVNALEAGADVYLVKPVAFPALDQALARFMSMPPEGPALPVPLHNGPARSATRLKFWGVRGSIPSPGPDTVYYGGNTSCVEVRVGSDIIVLDAGSGVRKLGLSLVEEFKDRPIQLNLLITHTHWDHIQGFPFFLPAYDPKNKVTIYGYEGATQGLQNTLSSQMESPYFPISMRQMPGHIAIRELHEMEFQVNQVAVRAKFLNHPGVCTGYRLFTPGGSISYLPDVELFQRLRKHWDGETTMASQQARQHPPAEDADLVEFIRDSEILIMDSQYDAREYEKHIGWGHSCVEDSVAFALQANVKKLFLFHHDPDHTDDQISRMVARARQMAAQRNSSLIIEAAREGMELVLDAKVAAMA